MTDSLPKEGILARWRNIYGPKPLMLACGFLLALLAAARYLYETKGPWGKQILARVASGKGFELKHWIPYGIGWGCVAVIFVSLFVLATARWWMRPTGPAMVPFGRLSLGKNGKWLYLAALLLAAILSGIIRAPRLSHSFWNDEEMAFRAQVWGQYKVAEDGKVNFYPTTWQQTVYESEKGNNHVLGAIEARLGMLLINRPEKLAPEGVPAFQESAARAFPFFSSCLTIVALGWLGWILGRPRAGLAAALILAVHPWHMRYAVEMRGYSTHLLYLCLAIGCLIKALQSSGWRWWLLYGLTQALALLAFSGALYVAIFLNLTAAVLIFFHSHEKRVHWLRLVMANGVTLIPLAALLAPSLFQIMDVLKNPQNQGLYPPPTLGWLRDFWHHLCIGFPELHRNATVAFGTSLEEMLQKGRQDRWDGVFVHFLVPVLALAGMVSLCKRDWRGWLLVLPPILAAAMAFMGAAKNGHPFLAQYLIYLLPLFCLAVPWAPSWLPGRVGNVLFLVVGMFALVTRKPRDVMQQHDRQPMRQAAQLARQEGHVPATDHANTLTVVFGQSAGQIFTYDPRAILLQNRTDRGASHLQEIVQQSEKENRPLIVYFCNRDRAKREFPEVMAALAETNNWLQETTGPTMALKGVENMWSYSMYRYLPSQESLK